MALNKLFAEILQAHGLPQRQTFNEAEANRLHPEGCKCPDDSGSCEWCCIYYARSFEFTPARYDDEFTESERKLKP